MTTKDEETGLVPINDIETLDYDRVGNLWWTPKDKVPIRLGDMADSHLRNAALMLMGLGYQVYNASDVIKVQWLTAMRMEWERRRITNSFKRGKNDQ